MREGNWNQTEKKNNQGRNEYGESGEKEEGK